MLVIHYSKEVTKEERKSLAEILKAKGYKLVEVLTQRRLYGLAQGKGAIDIRSVGLLPYVEDVHRVEAVYPLVSREWKVSRTVIEVSEDVKIGGAESLRMIAGPCSVESEEQIERISEALVANGIRMMRGGVFKPRSNPYTFRGLGMEGLKMFHQIASSKGIKIISEVMEVGQIEPMYPYVDVYQVGARNTQNFNLLEALGKVDKPVLIKRGISGTIEELLQSAEYVFSSGNERIILCERGIRTYESAYRNCMDVNAIAILKEKTHLPVVADPSHGIGIRRFVHPIALASIAAGADAVLVETHYQPEIALSDAQQTLNLAELAQLNNAIHQIVKALQAPIAS